MVFVLGPVPVESVDEGGAGGHGAGLASLAEKGDSPSNSVEASPLQVHDLGEPHAGQAQPEGYLVPETVGAAVPACADEALVGLIAREPAPRVLRLNLAVGLGVLAAERRQVRTEVGGQSGPGAPGQEGPDAREALPDGVVGQGAAGARNPGEQVRFGQLRGVLAARDPEQVAQLPVVLLARARVGVAGQELEEDPGEFLVTPADRDDRRNG
ncbi:MAG TPA: hypothetical protein VFH50_13010 [Acidimicrobiales bacterium]|nr:hypothetical protein [Acidimicrobiales bacterium]